MLPNLFGSSASAASPSVMRGDSSGARSLTKGESSRGDDFSALVDRAARAREPRAAADTRAAKPSPSGQTMRGTQAVRPKAESQQPNQPAAARKTTARETVDETQPEKASKSDESKTVDVAVQTPTPQAPVKTPAHVAGEAVGAVGETAAGAAHADATAQADTPELAAEDSEGTATVAEWGPNGTDAAEALADLGASEETFAEPAADTARAAANAARLAKLISQSGGAAEQQGSAAASRAAADATGREAGRPSVSEEAINGFTSEQAVAVAANAQAGTASSFSFDERRDSPSQDQRATTAMHAITPAAAGSTFAMPTALIAETVPAAPAQGPGPETMNQLVQSMRTQFRNGIGEAVVRLNPDHLGAVSISLRVEHGTVTASVAAESASVRQWLESQEQTLRQSLAGQGLNLDRLEVHPDEREQARQEQANAKRRQPQQRMPEPDGPVFEIIV